MEIKAILIDDEPLALALLTEYLAAYPNIHIVQACENGLVAVKAIQTHQPDLVFLDIQMPKINGFEMLELLDEKPAVIFTTTFNEYAMQAFDAHAIDYLLKPFSEERLKMAIDKFMKTTLASHQQHLETILESPLIKNFQSPRIVVKDNHQIHIIPFADILYLEAADDYVKIYTPQKVLLKKKTMQYFESILPEKDFCRVHRSYLVQLNQIAKVQPYEKDGAIITLLNKKEIPVSKAGYKKFKTSLEI